MDVVPADAAEWHFDPFGGEIKDGFIHGRGAIDMKGQGIMELVALLNLKRKGVTPCRDILFMAVADEEMGGKYGVKYLLDNHPEDFAHFLFSSSSFPLLHPLNCAFVPMVLPNVSSYDDY